MVPFIWTPPALHAYYAIHASWGKRCHVLRFFIDPVIGDNDVGFYNMADPSEVLTAQKVNMTLPNDVVILHDMRRPWHTCGIEENKKNNKPVGNCRNIFEKVWRMMVYVADGSGGSCIADRDQKVGVDRAEWFVKVDSDTWLFPENVGRYAKSRDWSYNDHHYFGHVLNHRRDDRGVSIVVSRELSLLFLVLSMYIIFPHRLQAGGAVFYSRAALLVAADAFKHMPMDKGDEEEDGTSNNSKAADLLPQIETLVPQDDDTIIDLSKKWVDRMMADLALCPFTQSAGRSGIPLGPVHYHVDRVSSMEDAYRAYWSEVCRIEQVDQNEISTTLHILPEFCMNSVELFEQWADTLTGTLEALAVEELLQLIFFHPQWIFRDGGDRSGDNPANYARRSPWPMVNILRTKQVRVAQKGIPTGLVYQQVSLSCVYAYAYKNIVMYIYH